MKPPAAQRAAGAVPEEAPNQVKATPPAPAETTGSAAAPPAAAPHVGTYNPQSRVADGRQILAYFFRRS
jgi:hypothetical protein